MNRIEVRSKVWLELDGRPLLGGGREALLRRIHLLGSISAAAPFGRLLRSRRSSIASSTRLRYAKISSREGRESMPRSGRGCLSPTAL